MTLAALTKELMKNRKFRREYKKKDLRLDISLLIEEWRIKQGFTQSKLARRMNTKQEAIARVERGNYMPSLSFLERVAKAFGAELEIKFKTPKREKK